MWLPGLFLLTGFPWGSIRTPSSLRSSTWGFSLPGVRPLPCLTVIRVMPLSSTYFGGPFSVCVFFQPCSSAYRARSDAFGGAPSGSKYSDSFALTGGSRSPAGSGFSPARAPLSSFPAAPPISRPPTIWPVALPGWSAQSSQAMSCLPKSTGWVTLCHAAEAISVSPSWSGLPGSPTARTRFHAPSPKPLNAFQAPSRPQEPPPSHDEANLRPIVTRGSKPDVMKGPFLTDFVRKGPFITRDNPATAASRRGSPDRAQAGSSVAMVSAIGVVGRPVSRLRSPGVSASVPSAMFASSATTKPATSWGSPAPSSAALCCSEVR